MKRGRIEGIASLAIIGIAALSGCGQPAPLGLAPVAGIPGATMPGGCSPLASTTGYGAQVPFTAQYVSFTGNEIQGQGYVGGGMTGGTYFGSSNYATISLALIPSGGYGTVPGMPGVPTTGMPYGGGYGGYGSSGATGMITITPAGLQALFGNYYNGGGYSFPMAGGMPGSYPGAYPGSYPGSYPGGTYPGTQLCVSMISFNLLVSGTQLYSPGSPSVYLYLNNSGQYVYLQF